MNFLKNIKITKDNGILLFLFVIIAIITLAPLFNVGIITNDDFEYYITSLRGMDYWWEDAQCYANSSGRFYLITSITRDSTMNTAAAIFVPSASFASKVLALDLLR